MQFLEVLDSQGRKKQVPLDRPRLLIGREPSCDIHLPHPGVSRRHAQLQCTEQNRWLVQDLSSRNKVYLDNRAVQQFTLEPRKPFRIVDFWLSLLDPVAELRIEDESEASPDSTETGLSADPIWLEQLQLLQRGVGQLDEANAVLQYLAKDIMRLLHPQLLAIGLHKQGGHAWEIIMGEEDRLSLKNYLGDADNKVNDEQSSFQAWNSAGTKVVKFDETAQPVQILIPMKGRQGIIGHVFVKNPALHFLPKPLQRYLSLATSIAALAYDNLQLGQMRTTLLDLEGEREKARQIQIDLFPPTFEVDARLDAFAVNLPSAQVSGDYYDLIRTGPDTIAFVIADAMGHGMPAALLMAAVRAGLRFGLTLNLPWTHIFQGLDDLIRQGRADTFVTGMVGQINLKTAELTLVSAGHPAPSILVDGQPLTVPEGCLTRPWGLDMENSWSVGRLPLRGKRWSILCYTDGIADAASRSKRASGNLKLARYHRDNFMQSAEDICQGVLNEFAEPAGRSLADDQTLLVLCSA